MLTKGLWSQGGGMNSKARFRKPWKPIYWHDPYKALQWLYCHDLTDSEQHSRQKMYTSKR